MNKLAQAVTLAATLSGCGALQTRPDCPPTAAEYSREAARYAKETSALAREISGISGTDSASPEAIATCLDQNPQKGADLARCIATAPAADEALSPEQSTGNCETALETARATAEKVARALMAMIDARHQGLTEAADK